MTRPAALVLVVALTLTGCGSGEPAPAASPVVVVASSAPVATTPSTREIRGSLTIQSPRWSHLAGGDPCEAKTALVLDIREGTQVTVTDASGAIVAVGRLGPGVLTGTKWCRWPFTVGGIPTGSRYYGIEIAERGRIQIDALNHQLADLVIDLR